MGILHWIIFGGIAGWLASVIMKSEGSLLWDIILGIIGAVVGGFIMNLFGQPSVNGFNVYSMFVAVLGSVVLIWIGRKMHFGYR